MKMQNEMTWMSATEIAHLVKSRKISPVEVVDSFLDRIEQINPKVNAFCTVMGDEAREAAKQAEREVMEGKPLGPLHGVPIAIKDLTPVKGVRFTMGSKLFENHIADTDSEVVKRIKQSGAIIIGKTNTPEFGHKGTTDNLVFGATRNPWNLDRVSGGSSGGAAAAVAAGLVPIAEGSDGGGSIRIPAALCGVYGFKASFGRIPPLENKGAFSSQAPFLHLGPISRTVNDAALLYDVMEGPSTNDPFGLEKGESAYHSFEYGIEHLKIAYSPNLGYFEIDKEVEKACEEAAKTFEKLGCDVEKVNPAFNDPKRHLEESWMRLWYGMIATSYGDLRTEQFELLEPQVQEFIKLGKELTATDYLKANYARTEAWSKLQRVFDTYDLIICPTTALPAFSLDILGPTEINGQPIHPLFGWLLTYPINLTGHPTASVPCGFSRDGLPIGLQIIGRRFQDITVFQASRAFERLVNWNQYYSNNTHIETAHV